MLWSLSLQLAARAAWVQEQLLPQSCVFRESRAILDACWLLFKLVLIPSSHPCQHQSTIQVHSFQPGSRTSPRLLLLSSVANTTYHHPRASAPSVYVLASTPDYKRHINMATPPTLRHRASRPAYLNGLFSPKRSVQGCRSRTPCPIRSSYSSTESINASMSTLDNQQTINHIRPLTPAREEELEANSSGDDSRSVLCLSLSRSLKPCLRLRNFSLHRRSESQFQCGSSSRPTSGDSTGKISPNIANFFQGKTHPNPTTNPLPPLPAHAIPPPVQSQELTCHRCYYFAARNCKGWTMGGSSNDACETCLVSFGRLKSFMTRHDR